MKNLSVLFGCALSLCSSLAFSKTLTCSNEHVKLSAELSTNDYLNLQLEENSNPVNLKIKGLSFDENGNGALVADQALLVVSGPSSDLVGELTVDGKSYFNLNCEIN